MKTKIKIIYPVMAFDEPHLVVNMGFLQIWEMNARMEPFYSVVGLSHADCIEESQKQICIYLMKRN